MKTIGAGLLAHIQSEVTTLATCIKITREDGVVFGFTDHDRDITFGGQFYVSSRGHSVSAVVSSAALNVDNLEITGFLDDNGITESDVNAGRWDHATVEIFEVNWADTSQGNNKLRNGTLGDVTIQNNVLTAEIRGMAQYLQQTIGETCSKFCKADLFDARCKVVATEGTWKFTGYAVLSVTSNARFVIDGLTQDDDFFTNGKLTGVTGANAGITREISAHVGSGSPASAADLTLFDQMPFDVQVGDTFTVYAGCQKRYTEDCVNKFSNGINFRGFPTLPGSDEALVGP